MCRQTRQMTNNLRDELIWGMNSASELATVYYHTLGVSREVASLLRQMTKLGVLLRQKNDIAVIDIFNNKKRVAIMDALILFIFTRCLLPSVLHKIWNMIFAILNWTHSDIVFDKCHKNKYKTRKSISASCLIHEWNSHGWPCKN